MSALRLNKDLFSLFLVSFIAVGTGLAITTGIVYLWLPLCLLAIYGWIRFAERYRAESLIIIVIFSESLFFTTDLGLSARLVSDIGLVLMLPLIVLHFRRVWSHISRGRSAYAIAILIFFCAILISLYFGSHLKFGQPMSVGLIVARKYLLFCSYFFLVAVGASREDCFRFMKYLAWLGALIAFCSILEVALGEGVIFPYAHNVGLERAGKLRINVGSFLIVFSVVYSFIKLQYLSESNQQRLWHFFSLGLGLFVLGFIIMTRAIILGLFVTFIFWSIRRITSRKIMYLCAAVSFVLIIILSGVGSIMLSETFVGEVLEQTLFEFGADKGNISIRKKGAQYYLDLVMQHAPLTGVGRFSDLSYPNNPITLAAELYHYRIVDTNGISTFVSFGLLGGLMLAFFVIISLRDAQLAMSFDVSSEQNYFEILFFIFIYILATPTLHNIMVEGMLMYSGIFFYLLSQAKDKDICRIKML